VEQILWAVTLRSFREGKGRLASALDAEQRASLARATAWRVLEVCRAAGGAAIVVTPSTDIAAWADDLGVEVVAEPSGGGLDGAATAAAAVAAARGSAFAILHADLPLLRVEDLDAVAACTAPAVLAPSYNGGTSLLAASEPIRFRYGPGSFHRHLAALAHLAPAVVVTQGLAVDLDTPVDLHRAARLERGSWLRPFLS
jgi:2-phospho-L-lactate guanylyltransferase